MLELVSMNFLLTWFILFVYVDSQAMALGLQLVSAFWFYKILRMVKHKVVKRVGPNKTAKTPSHKIGRLGKNTDYQ